MDIKKIAAYIGLPLLVVWLVWLTLFVIRQDYFTQNHELQLSVQLGMTLSEATHAWGSHPKSIWTIKSAASVNRIPRYFMRFKTGKIVFYGNILQSSGLWVHIDDNGFVDSTFFIRS